ncbi:MAG: phytanoyl-CoA dioxygenase family protein [Kiloniellales bacterium]|nr:phytanoyl-CoA dioxygenase family protein [Kiloniellales bacterium]
MSGILSETERARYHRDGCVFPITLMAPHQAAAHRRRLEVAEAEQGPMHYRVKPYLFFTSADEIARNARLLDAVGSLLGPDILLWDSAYVIKEPHSGGHVTWHQDLTYWGLSADEVVTAWVALSPVTPENGCMRFIPGSHENGRLDHRDTHAADNILHRGQEIAIAADEERAVDIPLAPGQASLHHGWVVHGSAPNGSDERRIGLTLQYLTPRVRQTLTDRESATLVRGEDRFGHFRPEPRCERDFDPVGMAFQREVEQLKHEVYDTA